MDPSNGERSPSRRGPGDDSLRMLKDGEAGFKRQIGVPPRGSGYERRQGAALSRRRDRRGPCAQERAAQPSREVSECLEQRTVAWRLLEPMSRCLAGLQAATAFTRRDSRIPASTPITSPSLNSVQTLSSLTGSLETMK